MFGGNFLAHVAGVLLTLRAVPGRKRVWNGCNGVIYLARCWLRDGNPGREWISREGVEPPRRTGVHEPRTL